MRRPALRFALLAFFLAAAPAAAQKLQPGTWTGTISPPGEIALNVTFDVSVSGDTTRITASGDMGSVPFDNVRVLADRITFTFEPGTLVTCNLLRQDDGSFRGDCTDSEGGTGVIHMIPPKKD